MSAPRFEDKMKEYVQKNDMSMKNHQRRLNPRSMHSSIHAVFWGPGLKN